MAGPDPLSLARAMAEADLARSDVAKAAGAAPSLGDLVMEHLPLATALASSFERLDGQVGAVLKAAAETGAVLRLIAEQDQQRREEAAARHARLQERIRNPQDQVRFAPFEGERFAELREALKVAGMTRVPHANGRGTEPADG